MPLSRLERETVINWNEAEPTASIYTSSPMVIRRLTRRFKRGPDRFGASWGEWIVPREWVTLPRAKTKRKATAGQLANLGRETDAASK